MKSQQRKRFKNIVYETMIPTSIHQPYLREKLVINVTMLHLHHCVNYTYGTMIQTAIHSTKHQHTNTHAKVIYLTIIKTFIHSTLH